MTKVYTYAIFILFLLCNLSAKCQVDTSGVIITNVSCNGGNNGSVLYTIGGGPGPVKYSWSNGVTGYATGSCTYAVTVNNPGSTLTQFQIPVNVTIAAGMHADFSNIVFMDSVGNLFPFWLTDFPTATNATFWVRVPNIPAGASVFYLSFCGAATTSASNPNTTFEFFDNFDGGNVGTYTGSCFNIDQAGESCNYAADNTQSFSPGYSLSLSAASSCFSAPFDGAGSTVSKNVPMVNDSLVIDYEDQLAVTLYGFCSGGTGTSNAVLADNNNLGGGPGASQGGSCVTNIRPWRAETSLPFAVTVGNTTIGFQVYGGDCDNSQGWFDDVRVRKYRANPPTDTLLVTPQLSLNNLTAGTYTLTLTDITGATVTRTIVITEPTALQVVADSSNNPCAGSGNGLAWAVVNNGTPPYSLLWSINQTTDTITGLIPGTYSVVATDNNGCTASANTHIALITPLQATVHDDSVNCYGASTGLAWVVVTGGEAPYQYQWTNGATNDSVTGLAAGPYGVMITDVDGCTATTAVNITQPSSAFTTTLTTSPVTCFGLTNGKVWANSAGGTTPYHFIWNTGPLTDTLTNLAAGVYTVTAVDNAGCADTVSAIISPPNTQLTIVIDSVNELCNGGNSGSASVTTSGGTIPYNFHWSNNANTPSISSLTAGAYNILVTDSFGCTVTGSVSIRQPQPLTIAITSHSPLCAGSSNGDATAVASGGTSPYSYSWSTGANTATVTALTSGAYTVTVKDNNLCSQTSQISIAPSEQIMVAQQQVTASCADSTNGAINITPSGGSTPYGYLWSNGATSQNLNRVGAGSFSLVVTDSLGCSATFTGNVPVENFSVSISAIPDSVILSGDEVTLNVNGAGAASAIWQPLVTFNDINGLSVTDGPVATTVYHVSATSVNGCDASASLKIVVHPKPQWLIPTGFSPNGDGVNDYFHIVLRGPVDFVSMSIFNRWGEKIFETTSQDPGWDGTFQERPQPVGVYVYQLQLRNKLNGANTAVSESGNVTLIR